MQKFQSPFFFQRRDVIIILKFCFFTNLCYEINSNLQNQDSNQE